MVEAGISNMKINQLEPDFPMYINSYYKKGHGKRIDLNRAIWGDLCQIVDGFTGLQFWVKQWLYSVVKMILKMYCRILFDWMLVQWNGASPRYLVKTHLENFILFQWHRFFILRLLLIMITIDFRSNKPTTSIILRTMWDSIYSED